MANLASVISFCTHDARFLNACLTPLKQISKQILIPVCDHFYDGTPENRPLLNAIYSAHCDLQFIEFAYNAEEVYGTPAHLVPTSPDWATHWHNTARYIGYFFLDPSIEWVLFCDVDEIFEAEALAEWLKVFPLEEYEAVRFATYWYFRSARYRATRWPDGPLLVKRSALFPDLLLDQDERAGIFRNIQGKKQNELLGLQQKPLVHHYSWVRSEDELLNKSRSWGHSWERDWSSLIKNAWEKPFQGRDFVRDYTYEEIEPTFDPLQEPLPQATSFTPAVQRVTSKQIYRLATQFLLDQL